MEASTTTYAQVLCPYCGAYHEGMCPRVEELEYYPDGTLKRVRLRQEPAQVEVAVSPVRPEAGHTCGVDCPVTVC